MINGKVTKLRACETNQSSLYFTEKRNTTFSDCGQVSCYVCHLANSGISLFTTGEDQSGKNTYSGEFGGIYCKIATYSYQKDQNICTFQRDIYQQSCQSSAGGIFSKKGSWRKKRDKLGFLISMIGCGSKSSLRFTISLSLKQLTTITPMSNRLLNN